MNQVRERRGSVTWGDRPPDRFVGDDEGVGGQGLIQTSPDEGPAMGLMGASSR